MRTTAFGPEDARATGTLCGAQHPFHDLSPDLTCIRPLGHEWEHAVQLRGRRADDPFDYQGEIHYDWVWWADPRAIDVEAEQARLQASAFVAAKTGNLAARETTIALLRRRGGLILVLMLFAIYGAMCANQAFNDACIRTDYLSKGQAWVCNIVFVGDDRYNPGPQFTDRLTSNGRTR